MSDDDHPKDHTDTDDNGREGKEKLRPLQVILGMERNGGSLADLHDADPTLMPLLQAL